MSGRSAAARAGGEETLGIGGQQEQLPSREPGPAASAAPARLWWAPLAAVSFVFGYTMNVLGGVNPADEAWFLYVLHSLERGEALYRDVWYGALPLAAWFGVAFTKVLGNHILVLKAAAAVCFVLTVVAAAAAMRRMGVPRRDGWFLLAAMLAFAAPGVVGPGSLYTPLAYALLGLTLVAALRWVEPGEDGKRRTSDLLLAALFAALALNAKQDVGAYAMLALTALVVAVERARPARAVALVLACWGVLAAVTAVVVAPVVATGSFQAFLADTVLSKLTHIQHSRYGYAGGLRWLAAAVFHPRSVWSVGDALRASLYLLPLLAVPMLLAAFARRRDAKHGAVLLFTVAALAGTWPRTDYSHLAAAVPFLVLALCVGWGSLKPGLPPALARSLAAALVLVLAGRAAFAVLEIPHGFSRRAGFAVSQLPHFRGAPIHWRDERNARMASEALREETGSRTLMVIGQRAGMMLLASGLENHTRYDYPVLTALEGKAEAELVSELRAGRLQAIWFDYEITDVGERLPPRLRYFMWDEMFHHPKHPWGRLYTVDFPPGRGPARKQ